MRSELDVMRRAGITRSRFRARFARLDHRGYIVLEDVETPVGTMDHIWIRPKHWHGPLPYPGDNVEFKAQIEPYWRDDGTEDLGLFRLQVIGWPEA